MIRKSISLVALSMLFSSCVSMAPKLEVNSDEVVAKKLFLAASFKLLFLPNKSSSKIVPTDAL